MVQRTSKRATRMTMTRTRTFPTPNHSQLLLPPRSAVALLLVARRPHNPRSPRPQAPLVASGRLRAPPMSLPPSAPVVVALLPPLPPRPLSRPRRSEAVLRWKPRRLYV